MTTTLDYSSTEQSDTGRPKTFVGIMLLIVVLRLGILAVGILSLHNAAPGEVPAFNAAHHWLAWDARHYYEVALNGYAPDRIGKPYDSWSSFSLIAYFPVMPLASRALSVFISLDLAMVVLSNVCAIIGFAFLYDWARRITNPRTAVIGVLIAATFPGAISFAAGMTDGLFFMLTAMAVWLLARKHWFAAAIVVGIATATRPTGVAVAIVVPFNYWLNTPGQPLSKKLAAFFALGIISVSGLAIYEAFIWHRYHSPTAYFEAQANWSNLDQQRAQVETARGVDRHSLHFYIERLNRPQVWNRGIALVILIITLAGFSRQRHIPKLLFLIPLIIFLMTALPGKGLRVSSLPRYESAAVPLFLLVAIWLAPRRYQPLMVGFILLQLSMQVYYAYLFPREIWVG